MKTKAYEFARELEKTANYFTGDHFQNAALMIRDLADENEQLKNDISTLAQEHLSMRARMERLEKEMLNEQTKSN